MAASRDRRWLKGCGLGCGGLLVLAVLGIVGGSLVLMGPFGRAIDTRQELDRIHGDRTAYVPAPDGAVTPQRMEAFLAVRRSLMAGCDGFGATERQFARLDGLEKDAPRQEVLREGWRLTRAALTMGPRMGEFFAARNRALLEGGMGRAEYAYIYTMAYHDQLLAPRQAEGEPSAGFSSHKYGGHVRAALLTILERQLASLDSLTVAGAVSGAEPAGQRDALAREILALRGQRGRLPWQDGLPPALAASLAPYRQRLDAVFCPWTVNLEHVENSRWGLGVRGD